MILAPGDVVRIKGTHVTCRVMGGTPRLESLRMAALAGSYGVRMGEKTVTVFRVNVAKALGVETTASGATLTLGAGDATLTPGAGEAAEGERATDERTPLAPS